MWDFKEYTHKVQTFKDEKGNQIRVDHLQKGTSNIGYVKFVNCSTGLSVFGDFGNWIFSRPFIPYAGGKVSYPYWNEKLKIRSCQDHARYDSEATSLELEEMIKGGLEEYGYEGNELEELKEWFNELLRETDDELGYTHAAYRGNCPSYFDYDDIPFCKTGSVGLEIVFLAFNTICERLKEDDKLD